MLPAIVLAMVLGPQDFSNGVPKPLLNKLTNGVNITRWLGYVDPNNQEYFRTYMKPADYANFKTLGVKFVRLCLNPDVVYEKGSLRPSNAAAVDRAVDELIKHGLLVIFDLHDNGQLKLDEPGHDNSGFFSFWKEIAGRYKGKHKNNLVFELVNEPIFQKNPEVWYALQKEAVKAIRSIDPKRTILAASTSWNGIDTFVKMEPLPEKNIIYSFHCYDPFFFTHQGASWVGPFPKDMKSVPFPSSPEAVAAILPKNDAQFHDALKGYGNERYDAAYLRKRIKSAADWGRKNHAPVVLGEFGAYPPVAPPESRANWFKAMRAAVDAEKVPFAIWGYDDALGLGRKVNPDGTIWLDPVTLKAFYGVR
jgi:endoglucanase